MISHPVKTNDRVLALIDGTEKYAPAEVLEGFEARDEAKQCKLILCTVLRVA